MAALFLITMPTGWVVLGSIALVLVLLVCLAGLFGPTPHYRISSPGEIGRNGSESFLNTLESLTDAKVNRSGTLDVLPNGPNFYPAALEAMRAAQHSICLEAYIFQEGEIAGRYVETMAERARAGVKVHLTLDGFGSMSAREAFFKPLLDAGGKVEWYNKPRWYNVARIDNRTHRELLIVDGNVAFIGGAGVADQWFKAVGKTPRWRDTLVRVSGEAVPHLLATFAENWLTSHGEVLVGPRYFPGIASGDETVSMVINSTPSPGGATRARVLFQMLVASAESTISIQTPYFLPDKGLVKELCRAVERGVKLRILVPGRAADHMLTRNTSRGGYGLLLKAGAEVFEYEPSMIHVKVMVVDRLWAVIGSTNFDNRSFGINDEVNLAVRQPDFAARLEQDMEHDLTQSHQVSAREWEHRPVTERATEMLGWIFERQQ